MNKKDWIKWGLVFLVVVLVPGGFLLAGYHAKKKLEKKLAEQKGIAIGEPVGSYSETIQDTELKDTTLEPAIPEQ